jgi:Mg2+ and Co2+ transporter CorA
MSDSARDHKTKQDELLRKNAQLRDQLMSLRRNLVEAKRIHLEENAQYEERVH